jgi:hypothetical protein
MVVVGEVTNALVLLKVRSEYGVKSDSETHEIIVVERWKMYLGR